MSKRSMRNITRRLGWYALPVLLSLSPMSAHAEALIWGKVNGWNIYLDSKKIDGCYASRRYDDGTYFRFSIETGSKSFNLIFHNVNWPPIIVGQIYNIDFVFADETEWLIPMVAHALPTGGTFLKYSGTEADLLSDVAEKSALVISHEGNSISRLSLESSYEALLEVTECQKVLISTD